MWWPPQVGYHLNSVCTSSSLASGGVPLSRYPISLVIQLQKMDAFLNFYNLRYRTFAVCLVSHCRGWYK